MTKKSPIVKLSGKEIVRILSQPLDQLKVIQSFEKGVVKISLNIHFPQQYLPQFINIGHMCAF